MTTQTTRVSLISADGSYGLQFTATSTDDQWNEQLDSVNGLSLYKVIPLGTVIDRFIGQYADGCACFRVRNTADNRVKCIENLPMIKGQYVDKIYTPFKVEMNDVVEVFCTAEQS